MQVILTHENADFDAIASLLGAHKLFPTARPVLPRRINRNVQAFLALYGGQLPFVDPQTLPRGHHIHRVILVDTQTLSTVRGMSPKLDEVRVIDHHAPPEQLPENWRYQGQPIGANATLLTESISARLIPLTQIEATLLLTGIYEDTGSLTYASTTSRDLRAAAWLIDQGGNLEIANDFIQHPLTVGQQQLYEQLFNNAENLQINGHPIVLAHAQAPPGLTEEISTLAHKLRELLDPSALFILVGLDGNTQIVARSTTDDVNVADVVSRFGGSGHDRAAAALVRGRPPTAVLDELRALLPNYVQARVTVRELMSHRVRTVSPDTLVCDVAEQMSRSGHEGFPVVEEGRVVGLVTRNAVDRALRHRWARQPVRRIMEPGEITVAPDDSAERVRTLMIETGWGQLPVVADGELTGVVTRTDLIRLPPTERERERRRLEQRMAQAFPTPLLALIHQAGERATELGYELYFVGGLVRDLLLGQPLSDVDLVVEGEAIVLARVLANEHGGEVRSHARFGTAKWLLGASFWRDLGADPAQPDLPDFIDLVTARTEFYEHPTALPLIEHSSIKQDLLRRDFTINTLAIRLNPGHWGELLDFFGGQADLENGVIRVLHSLSFVDDPTRILRAARFEARLDFQLDPRSESLIAEALPLLGRVTGGRIRHELDLIFEEAAPEKALQRLQELGALQEIHPALTLDSKRRRHFARLREEVDSDFWGLDADDRRFLNWALCCYWLPREEIAVLAQQLLMSRRLSNDLLRLPTLRQLMRQLAQLQQPSQIVARLEGLAERLLPLAWLMTTSTATRDKLAAYWRTWRHVAPELTGEDLKALGIPPGPLYREIFAAIRTARLDGELHTRAEEIALARRFHERAG